MQPLFPPWSNSIFRVAIGVAAASIVGIPLFLMAWVRTPYMTGQESQPVQPIKFDHRHHVRDDGIDCTFCHRDVQRSSFAGVPPTSLCMGCHAQVWPESPELAPLRASAYSGEPIHWVRVNALPEHVYFPHDIHVAKGVGCVSCHGRVDLMGQVYQAEPLTMSFCLECHRDPDAHLRPPDKVTDMEWVPDRPQREVGAEVRKALNVQPTTDCSGCHR